MEGSLFEAGTSPPRDSDTPHVLVVGTKTTIPLNRPEYTRINLSDIPQELIDKYNLKNHACNGWVYFNIWKGVYGLSQSGKLEYIFSPSASLTMTTTLSQTLPNICGISGGQ